MLPLGHLSLLSCALLLVFFGKQNVLYTNRPALLERYSFFNVVHRAVAFQPFLDIQQLSHFS